jgi:hypothetical protein
MLRPLSYLIEFLEENENWQTPKEYYVHEWFTTESEQTERMYKVYNLLMYEENDTSWADDAEGYIQNNNVNLKIFPKENIVYLQFHEDEPYITITIADDTYDGYIRIYY